MKAKKARKNWKSEALAMESERDRYRAMYNEANDNATHFRLVNEDLANKLSEACEKIDRLRDDNKSLLRKASRVDPQADVALGLLRSLEYQGNATAAIKDAMQDLILVLTSRKAREDAERERHPMVSP